MCPRNSQEASTNSNGRNHSKGRNILSRTAGTIAANRIDQGTVSSGTTQARPCERANVDGMDSFSSPIFVTAGIAATAVMAAIEMQGPKSDKNWRALWNRKRELRMRDKLRAVNKVDSAIASAANGRVLSGPATTKAVKRARHASYKKLVAMRELKMSSVKRVQCLMRSHALMIDRNARIKEVQIPHQA